MSTTEKSGGGPLPENHRDINPATGQQKAYVVLTPEERAKGFVRPVRRSYVHVGPKPPANLRPLTAEQIVAHDAVRNGYVAYEEYGPEREPVVGKCWTQAQLDAKGCRTQTTMAQDIAETYARDPGFYSGTFCVSCRAHFPLDQFVWEDGTVMGT